LQDPLRDNKKVTPLELVEKVIIRRLFKNAQIQVELCEIPLAGALEILRSEAYLAVRRNDEG
jgi:hypothetical protein